MIVKMNGIDYRLKFKTHTCRKVFEMWKEDFIKKLEKEILKDGEKMGIHNFSASFHVKKIKDGFGLELFWLS